jgi:EAL domain-containing protein (putative c-di-GMP-specific phosphodiesterase class I)
LVGAEALLRWHDQHHGWISPAEFVAVAETRGMMLELGAWVLRSACCQIRQWQDEGCFQGGRIAVNISARQLEDSNFSAMLTSILEETGVAPGCLELELTESILMSDPERITGILTALKSQGFSLAIDDFGTGYSSLAYLKRFPVDTLKIDRAFVRDMLDDHHDRAIVATITAMAQQLGLTTVAEGIEEEGQRQLLLELGCLHGQGFHFSRPKPPDLFKEKWLINNRGGVPNEQ